MKKRVVCVICMISLLLPILVQAVPTFALGSDSVIIEEKDLPLRLHYDEEAMYANEDQPTQYDKPYDDGWEKWSLPVGNGYFGANVFGRTETERIQITEKTLSNPYYKTSPKGETLSLGGLNNFSETYIDIGHPHYKVKNYSRWLDLKTAICGVSYDYDGVTYSREVFTSYPDKALVIRLDASESGKLSFVLRPTVPWKQDYAAWEGDRASKTGKVVSYVDGKDGVIELSGKMGYYDVDFLGIYRVVTDGGEVSATTCKNEYNEIDGTITVSGATSAYIYVVLGSDYELCEEMFTTGDAQKPTFKTDIEYTRKKIQKEADAIASKLEGKSFNDAYMTLKDAHVSDHSELFGRVTLDLGDSNDASLTTDKLLEKYKSGEHSRYLETLYFQYGRYLLIASSRPGTLPSNLQGTWNRYNKSPWGSGMWHNVNEQMNYWPAFSTNVAESFEAYVSYNQAYMKAAESYASDMVRKYNNALLDEDGGNGWCIGTGAFPYQIGGDRSAGNLGFTTQLYWEYYQYTQDKAILESIVYPTIVSAARYIVKTVELTEDGKYLVSYCDSPEMYVNGVWYYTTGTTYAQSFAYQNNYNALLAAKELGIDISDAAKLDSKELCIFKRLMEQLDKYDPIKVGLSGQIKEFREEDYYGSVGDEPDHRHISQLVGLYPGNIINSNTPAWLDAAKVTLTMRGDNAGGWGWGYAFRLNLWARTKDGDRAYLLLNGLLEKCTMTNLWDYGTLFQIDGNFGGTAGISELLLQSHEGYIEPLAALPSAWDSGSYTGLVARGNFEVSAAWDKGVAKTFNIKSLSGKELSVSYGGIGSAEVIRASDGKKINYTVSGNDRITFETEKDETYIISGFKSIKKLPAPASLELSRSGLGATELSWDAVSGAVGYNVYVAIEDQPTYTLIAHTAQTKAEYLPKLASVNARTTFKVVPLDSEGVEGEGVIAYQNPIDIEPKLIGYEAFYFEDGELQVTLKASENTQKYKLWRKTQGSEYSLICETPYPIIVYEGYSESDTYAVSLVSNALRTESELVELTKIRNYIEGADSSSAERRINLLDGLKFEAAAGTAVWSSDYGYEKLTDGLYGRNPDGSLNVHIGRYSSKGVKDAYMDGTAFFESSCLLSEMRLYDFGGATSTRLGNEVKVYALNLGEWKEVYSLSGNAAVISARILDAEKQLYYLPIDLSGVKADAVRVYAKNSIDANGVTFYEITCSGTALAGGTAYTENMLLGKAPDSFTHDTALFAGYDQSKLTDGSLHSKNGRYAQYDGTNNGFTVEYLLDGEAVLDTLKIYDFAEPTEPASRISSATVELYSDGKWVKYLDAKPLLAQENRATDDYGRYTPVGLDGAKAEKIRITLKNTAGKLGVTIYEIMLSGYVSKVRSPERENILLGKEFVAAEGTNVWNESYGYDKLTDGVYNKDANGNTNYHIGRYSSGSGANERLEGTAELGGVYELSEMRIYDYTGSNDTKIGKEVRVDAYYAGEWRTVYSKTGYTSILNARVKDNSLGLWYLPVDLSGVKAAAIRVYVLTDPSAANVTLYEITCSGSKLAELSEKNIIQSATFATVTAGEAEGRELSASQKASLTDKNADTAFDIGTAARSYCLEFDLGQKYSLYTLKIKDKRAATDIVNGSPATRSDDTCVELYVDGECIEVVSAEALSLTEEYTLLELYGLTASKLRVRFNNTQTFDNGTSPAAVISEIYLSIAGAAPDKKPLLNAYAGLPIIADGDEKYLENMKKFKEYVTEFALKEEDVASYAKEMWDYNGTLLDGTHTAHSIKQYEEKAPNCVAGGWFAYEACELCDYTTFEAVVPAGHDVSGEWQSDGGYHWKKCLVCGELDESTKAEHVFDNSCDDSCNVCAQKRSVTHTYSGECDSECDICGLARTATGTHSGGEATCTKKAVCSVCGEEYGELAKHSYSSEWKSDETHHWHECFCGEPSEREEHVFGDWTQKDGQQSRSCLCGYTQTQPIVKKPFPAFVITAIAAGAVLVLGAAGFCLYRFAFKKKK